MFNFLAFVFLNFQIAQAGFGGDAAILIAQDAVNGALLMSTIADDVYQISETGLSYTELENLAVEHSKEAAKLKGEFSSWSEEAQRIKFMDKYNKKSSQVTKNLKRIKRLLRIVCSYSPENCTAASQYEQTNLQYETNTKLESVIELLKADQKRKDLNELRILNTRIKTLNSLQELPEKIILKVFQKW